VSIELAEPTVIERIRIEKVGADKSSFTTKFSIRYAPILNDPPLIYSDENGTKILVDGNNPTGLPSELIVLPKAIEAQTIMLHIEDYSGSPCMKVEVYGCRKTNCHGKRHLIDLRTNTLNLRQKRMSNK
jgi:hypothetical protein